MISRARSDDAENTYQEVWEGLCKNVLCVGKDESRDPHWFPLLRQFCDAVASEVLVEVMNLFERQSAQLGVVQRR